MSILFLNHKVTQCGVYQYGKRFYDIIKGSQTYNFIYCEVESASEYIQLLTEYNSSDTTSHNKPIAILYNYHASTMPWLRKHIQRTLKNIAIIHESRTNMFDVALTLNPEESVECYLPRPIYENVDDLLRDNPISKPTIRDFITNNNGTSSPEIPVFGSFGFGFEFKGFEKIVELINKNYDVAIIKFVIPTAFFDPDAQTRYNTLYAQCMAKNTKPGIKVFITNEFFSNTDVLHFLASNTANIFLYDTLHGRSISSATDYAISVKKPLLISDSQMFRHIYNDSICPYKTPVRDCIKNSVQLVEKYYEQFSNKQLIAKINKIMTNTITYGQAYQDLFVAAMLTGKRDGRFLEIGSNHPITTNNSYLLETQYNWSGIMVEYDARFGPMYAQQRPKSTYIIADARKVDYLAALESAKMPHNMDYLQIDLDVDNKSTLDTLELLNNTVFDKYKFACITFETDIYRGDFFNTRQRSRDIFTARGYKLIFPDVCVFWEGGYKPFEDWWVHPDLVNAEVIKKFQTTSSLSCDDIKKMLQN